MPRGGPNLSQHLAKEIFNASPLRFIGWPCGHHSRKALEAQNVNLALAYVPENGSAEIRSAFEKVTRKGDPSAREVADLYFFETVVRLHRAGEGAPYTGLKPAGLDEGPVIPVAEKAIETGSPDALINLLTDTLRQEVQHRFKHVLHLRGYAPDDVARARQSSAREKLSRQADGPRGSGSGLCRPRP